MTTFRSTITASIIAMLPVMGLANTNMKITNQCDNWVRISSVHASIGNMRCKVDGVKQGTNADFKLQPGKIAKCGFTTTHGLTSVGFTISDDNPLQTAEVFVNNVTVAMMPLVNPIAHTDGDDVNATCNF